MHPVVNPTEARSASAFGGEFEGPTAALDAPSSEPIWSSAARWTGITATVLAASYSGVAPATFNQYTGAATNEQFYRGNYRRLPAQNLISQWAEMEAYRHLKRGWDGIGSVPADAGAIDNAQAFLALLPPGTKAPEPTVAADGVVGWYWNGADRYLDVSFFSKGKMAYYGYAGEMKVSDAGQFDGQSVGQPLLDLIAII
jgi:hypothetical protein